MKLMIMIMQEHEKADIEVAEAALRFVVQKVEDPVTRALPISKSFKPLIRYFPFRVVSDTDNSRKRKDREETIEVRTKI